jgi:hypothetical protein
MSTVKSFSVGDGDMFYINHNSDNFTIIDCRLGGDTPDDVLTEVAALSKQKGITRFISSHPDEDHILGLELLDKKITILNFYCVKNSVAKPDETVSFKRYCELRDSHKAFYIFKGCSRRWMNLSDEERKTSGIEILWPDVGNEHFKETLNAAAAGESPNNISAIIQYSITEGATFLWMGDLETEFMEAIEDDPRLGETVLDPACGTGGFLVEAYNHLLKQVKTVADRKILQEKSLFGCEPKTLPYLLCQMNLLLHGLDAPQIDPGNSLRFKLTDIGERDRVDVILTNPPFGGEEEKGIQGNFPEDKQTAETALLFLQLIMRRLHRVPTSAKKPARAAVVVPESVMSDAGVAARIRREIVEDFNLHTIIRLPKGVFEPYSDIQTNLLFFDRDSSTKGVWFYEHEVPTDRQNMQNPCYTRSIPLRFEELHPIIDWWPNYIFD